MKKLLFIPMLFACFMSMGQAKTVGGKHFIGEKFGGGIVFHVTKDGLHGLIAATSDQSTGQSTGIRWGQYTVADTDSTGTAIGTGLSNTNYIIKEQDSTEAPAPKTSYAAGLARSYRGGGYTDWYLPSKDELFKLYEKRFGSFERYYWSSSLENHEFAWIQNFEDGSQQDAKVDQEYIHVRAIRAF
jgi:Protein of unknown function (DUF1566)